MIREWFDTTAVVEFGRELARELNRLHPPGDRQNKDAATRKDRKKLDRLTLRTQTFAQQNKLNVYKKAKLLNTVKWELRDAGQDSAFIEEMVSALSPLLNQR